MKSRVRRTEIRRILMLGRNQCHKSYQPMKMIVTNLSGTLAASTEDTYFIKFVRSCAVKISINESKFIISYYTNENCKQVSFMAS